MNSRTVVAAVLALVVTSATFAAAPEIKSVSSDEAIASSPAVPITLKAIFKAVADARAAKVDVRPGGMMVADAPSLDVLVARIGDDGSQVTVCVHDEPSGERFLNQKDQKERPVAAPQEQ